MPDARAHPSKTVDLVSHVETALPFVAGGLFALFAVFSISHWLLMPPRQAAVMTTLAAFTSLLMGSIALISRGDHFSGSRSHWIALFIAVLALANSSLHLWITHEAQQTTNFMLLVVGIASFFVHPVFFLGGITITSFTWFVLSWGALQQPEWRHFGFAYFTSVVLAALIFFVRLRILETLESCKLEDQQTRMELRRNRDTLSRLNEELEKRVETRTAEVTSALAELREEVARRKEAEATLIESEKLAASGRLAAALAHEINNPLSAVSNAIFLLRSGKLSAQDSLQQLEIAETELTRVTQIIRHILGFYRESVAPARTSVNQLVEESLTLFGQSLRRVNIIANAEYANDDRIVTFPGEVRQVLANLVANAVDAMPGGGRLLVRTKRAENGMWIFVADTGGGIEPTSKPRIFQPFFSTKGERGTGLGLWVCRSIMSKHRGRILVKSTKGRGSVFCVFFPDQLQLP